MSHTTGIPRRPHIISPQRPHATKVSRASERGGLHGHDGGKRVSGIKRHLLIDTRGTVLVACVIPANVGDRDGAVVLFSRAADALPRLRHVWADRATGTPTSMPGPRKPPALPCRSWGAATEDSARLGEDRDTATGSTPLRGGPSPLGG
ncbi:transposase [Streptomyces sp. NPDC006285]|uniref:transposase n=1 Tax=Streptomyces sp. NPDC006285 TaxID=3364742 RepID=UPI0036948957